MKFEPERSSWLTLAVRLVTSELMRLMWVLKPASRNFLQDHPIRAAVEGVLSELGIARAPACTLRITSTIPISAGMGSGAAVSVALMRALSSFLGHPLSNAHVSELAFEVEKIYHGASSGI